LLDALTEAASNVYNNIYDRNVILTLRYKFVILFLFHRISVWDLGGQTSIRCWLCHVEIDDINMMQCSWEALIKGLSSLYRPYWRCYYANTDAIIYVVDSADRDRLAISKSELISMLEVSVGM